MADAVMDKVVPKSMPDGHEETQLLHELGALQGVLEETHAAIFRVLTPDHDPLTDDERETVRRLRRRWQDLDNIRDKVDSRLDEIDEERDQFAVAPGDAEWADMRRAVFTLLKARKAVEGYVTKSSYSADVPEIREAVNGLHAFTSRIEALLAPEK